MQHVQQLTGMKRQVETFARSGVMILFRINPFFDHERRRTISMHTIDTLRQHVQDSLHSINSVSEVMKCNCHSRLYLVARCILFLMILRAKRKLQTKTRSCAKYSVSHGHFRRERQSIEVMRTRISVFTTHVKDTFSFICMYATVGSIRL